MFGYSFKGIAIFLIFILGACRESSSPSSESLTTTGTAGLVDEIKERIENFDEPISYCQFMDFVKQKQITERQSEDLIDCAYGHDNPILFRPAAKSIPPEHYSLNFLWLSSAVVLEKYPITGEEEEQLQKNILQPLSDWQAKQPEAKINFWYDGNSVKNGSIERTKDRLKQIGFHLENLRFRNLQDILALKSNPDLFDGRLPLFFRIDLAKAAVMDHVLRIDKLPYVATIDSDVAAITRGQFFDQRTLEALNSHGYIFGVAFAQEENSFIILSNNAEKDIVKMHQEHVLNNAIIIAQKKLLEGQPVAAETVFHRYVHFRAAINKIHGPRNSKLGKGKNMIFPPSQFGGGGYSKHQISALKKALVNHKGCSAENGI